MELTAMGLLSSSPQALSAFGFERAHVCDANYPPEEMALDAARRLVARCPPAIVFQEKWRLALTLVRRSQTAGLTLRIDPQQPPPHNRRDGWPD
jgi:hypothetical protein